MYIPTVKGKRYIVIVRNNLSGQVKARALSRANLKVIVKFVKEEIFYRHGQFYIIVINGGTKNQRLVNNLRLLYGFNKVTTLAYYPQLNPVERGHQQIKAILTKLRQPYQVNNLSFTLQVDRISIKSTTGISPFRFNYGYELLLPIKERINSQQSLTQSEVRSRKDLIVIRILQLQRRDKEIKEIGL